MKVFEIPTNKPIARNDNNDAVYANQIAKFKAIVEEIVEVHSTGQPVLVGTISVEKSEMLSELLQSLVLAFRLLSCLHYLSITESVLAMHL